MTRIQNLFAKNSKPLNIIFCILFSVLVVFFVAYAFIGHRFIYTAPAMIIATLIGLSFKTPRYYLPFCVGAFLQFGLFSASMQYLMTGTTLPVLIQLGIGSLGFILIVTSVCRAVLGEWNAPSWINRLIKITSVAGLLFFILVTSIIVYHSI